MPLAMIMHPKRVEYRFNILTLACANSLKYLSTAVLYSRPPALVPNVPSR